MEAIFLDRDAGGPQLKRNPLGGGMAILQRARRRGFTMGLIAMCALGCAVDIRDAIAKLPTATPEPPRTDEDIVASLVLRRAVIDEKLVPDYGLLPSQQVIILAVSDSTITPRILPVSATVRFTLLSPQEIKTFANRHDHFVYLVVGSVKVAGDSAIAGAGTTWAPSKRRPGIMYLSGGSCAWQYRKRDGQWTFEKSLGCIIS